MDTLSALQALCREGPPVTGYADFDIFFDAS